MWPNKGTSHDVLCLIREHLRIVYTPSREQFRVFYVLKREHVPTRKPQESLYPNQGTFQDILCLIREHLRIVSVQNQALNHKPSEYKAETLVTC